MRGRRLRGVLRAHVETWRPYTLWYAGLVGLAGATLAGEVAAHDRPPAARLAAGWLVPTLIWISAHYLGDYSDRRLDAIDKPQRPIPSGRIRPVTALVCGAFLAAAACVIAVAVNPWTVVVLAAGIGGAISYNAFFKARGLWGNAVRGSLTGLAFVFGELMAVSRPPGVLLPFVLVLWSHDAATNLVGTLRDIAGDRAGGYATWAVRRGVRTAVRTAAALHALAVAAAVAAVLALPGGVRAAALLLLLLAAAIAVRAFGVLGTAGDALTPRLALRSHEVLVAERLVLADALLAAGLGAPAALGILVPALAVTVGTQRAMRPAHEFAPAAGERPAGGPAAPPSGPPPRPAPTP